MRVKWLCLASIFLPAACSTPPAGDTEVLVVVSTSILGDVVRQVAGPQAQVETLMPPGADPHDFQPSAQQVARLQEADLVVWFDLGLESGLEASLQQADESGVEVLALAPLLEPIPLDDEDDDHEHGSLDPHVWQDPIRMAEGVSLVGERLAQLSSEPVFDDRAGAYEAEILDVHGRIEATLNVVPAERRKLVTNHEAFGYLAERYGFEIVGVVIPGGSTLAETSAARMAELVEAIRAANVPAVFTEAGERDDVMEALAGELGQEVEVVSLYSDWLGEEGSGAETYLDLLLTNAERIAEALR